MALGLIVLVGMVVIGIGRVLIWCFILKKAVEPEPVAKPSRYAFVMATDARACIH
jgi:hypothetical protein